MSLDASDLVVLVLVVVATCRCTGWRYLLYPILYPWFPFINTAVSVGGNPCCQALTTNQWRSPRCAAASSGAVPCEVPRAGLLLGWQGTLAPMKWIEMGEFHKDQNWSTDGPISLKHGSDAYRPFYFWVRSWNVLFCFDACARLAYSYMAASWGGYVFVLPLGRLAERWGMITRSVFNGVLTVWFMDKHPASKIRKTSSHYAFDYILYNLM